MNQSYTLTKHSASKMVQRVEHVSQITAAAHLCIDLLEFGLRLMFLDIYGRYGFWAVVYQGRRACGQAAARPCTGQLGNPAVAG